MNCTKQYIDEDCKTCECYKPDGTFMKCHKLDKPLTNEEWEDAAHMLGGD